MNPNNGKYRGWLAWRIIKESKPIMDDVYSYSLGQYVQKYYFTSELSIQYQGGTWASGQNFRVQLGGCVVIVSIGDL